MKNRMRFRSSNGSADSTVALVSEAARLTDFGRPEQALHLLNQANDYSDAARNARGVCLLRLHRIDDAVRTFRAFVLATGGTWCKPDLPIIYRTNFATALLLAGHPRGCLDILGDINQEQHPSMVRLQDALKVWQRGLSWWQWINWKTGIDPNSPVQLDFFPGEFFEAATGAATTPLLPPTNDVAESQAV
jgi:hypothetical protein